jgi:hypothetical protein
MKQPSDSMNCIKVRKTDKYIAAALAKVVMLPHPEETRVNVIGLRECFA